MSEILLAKPQLPSDWIDASVGEAHIVKDILFETFKINHLDFPANGKEWEYPSPNGYKPLIQLLEEKYQAPIIITNGAKQALGASFYALKMMGKRYLGMRTPYWALIPPLVKMHGLEPIPSYVGTDCNLMILPGNPDGFISRPDVIKKFSDKCKENKVPLIHDAAYYNHIYMPAKFPLEPIGDVQIYSISKMLGLSGLRLGFVVCHNTEFYKYILEYMEHMTVGVSNFTQIYLYELLNRMRSYPALVKNFEGLSYKTLETNRKIVEENINCNILEIEESPSNSMFLWAKLGSKADFKKAKINVIEGEPFGMSGMIRMNMAFPENKIKEIVKRLNSTLY